jgi:hypothetical protein
MSTAILAHSFGEIPSGAPIPFTKNEMIATLRRDTVLETEKNSTYSRRAVSLSATLNTRNLFQKKECVTTIANVIIEKNVISIPSVIPDVHKKRLKILRLKTVFKTPTSAYRTNFQPKTLCRSEYILGSVRGDVLGVKDFSRRIAATIDVRHASVVVSTHGYTSGKR